MPYRTLQTGFCSADRWLSEADAANGIWQKHRAYVTTAWRFLTDHGYINFGVAPAIHAKMLAAPLSRGAVIVIGAGMAGVTYEGDYAAPVSKPQSC
jgi:hypothetical protein